MQPIRTFVAVELELHVTQRAAQLIELLQVAEAKVKWVDPSNLHLTLCFLGNVEAVELPAVCTAVLQAGASQEPFEFDVRGVGAFPHAGRPRTVWLGVRKGEAELVELHDQLERHLQPLGFRGENRRFRPHLTIGRVRDNPAGIAELAQLIEQHRDFAAGNMFVHEVVVYSSELSRTGPTYDVLATAELSG